MINHLNENPTEELYVKTKDDISNLNLSKNKEVSEYLLRKAHLLETSNSLDEFTRNYLELNCFILEKENEKLSKKVNKLTTKNKKLKKQVKKQKKINKSLVNSSSWKLTMPLRGLKRIFKR